MKPKFKMSVDENIFFAKRNLVDSIWKSARLEGINVTFPQTYAIIEKAKVSDVNVDDILKITNLKRAWRIVLDKVSQPLTLDFLCSLNDEVARDESLAWGSLRTGSVYISGTDYIPPVPDAKTKSVELSCLLDIPSPTERAIEIMLWGMKSQLFWDGNKRTSMLAANKIMIENGCGILSVPIEKLQAFNEMLCDYYTNDTLEKAKQFIYEHCIDGADFHTQVKPATISRKQLKDTAARIRSEAPADEKTKKKDHEIE